MKIKYYLKVTFCPENLEIIFTKMIMRVRPDFERWKQFGINSYM